MNYNETIEFLYEQLPVFQREGASAYKAGLDTSLYLDEFYQYPHKSYKTIHVAGTNGKGSTSHLLAAILQLNGYKVGLYTSPHLVDFRERIRVNGEMISKDYITTFVNSYRNSQLDVAPSFFELTMMMAFKYFRDKNVDIAIIEVGLGGRLDSTNIIDPILSIITNISFDHTQFLGNTLPLIAQEKAGIIKPNTPVVIGEYITSTRPVFEDKAASVNANIIFAEDNLAITSHSKDGDTLIFNTLNYGKIIGELSGDCQVKNANTVLTAIEIIKNCGITISHDSIIDGFKTVCSLTGLNGRWKIISSTPRTICDTGHNISGIEYIVNQLSHETYRSLRIVIGFVNDKDISHILELLPTDATYYFTVASIPRALKGEELMQLSTVAGLKGNLYENVETAYNAAINDSSPDDMIFIGGSTFIVGDLVSYLNKK